MEFMTTDCTGKKIKVTTVPTPESYIRAGEELMLQMKAEQDRRAAEELQRWRALSLFEKAREGIAGLFAS